MIFILGGNGFLGSAITSHCDNCKLDYIVITKKNYHNYVGSSCDYFINCNGNSKKYLASDNPYLDFNLSVNSVFRSIFDFKCKKYIFLSSSEVYNDTSSIISTVEDIDVNPLALSPYGLNKFIAEIIVKKYAKNFIIFRLGGFVGEGLKKNPIYDMMNNNKLWISLESELQFLNTKNFAKFLVNIMLMPVFNEIINLSAKKCLKISDIYNYLKSKSPIEAQAPNIKNVLNVSKLESLIDVKINNSYEEVISFIEEQSE